MALAFHNRVLYKAPTSGELAMAFPTAELLFDGPRDLQVAAWPSTLWEFFEKRTTLPQHLRQLSNNPGYWYEELLKLAKKIEVSNSLKRNFTLKRVEPIKEQQLGGSLMTEKSESKQRKHLDKSMKITLKVTENPRRKGTHGFKSFEKMVEGMTVAEYLQSGGRTADLLWEIKKGHVTLS